MSSFDDCPAPNSRTNMNSETFCRNCGLVVHGTDEWLHDGDEKECPPGFQSNAEPE